MATVHRTQSGRVYTQTGFAQRGLGIGWRLENSEDIRPYFELMPVSLGVVFLTGEVAEIQRRNVARGKDRSHMVPLMVEPQCIAIETLRKRGVFVCEIDVMKPIEQSKAELAEFVRTVS
jgi:gluconate kinase